MINVREPFKNYWSMNRKMMVLMKITLWWTVKWVLVEKRTKVELSIPRELQDICIESIRLFEDPKNNIFDWYNYNQNKYILSSYIAVMTLVIHDYVI